MVATGSASCLYLGLSYVVPTTTTATYDVCSGNFGISYVYFGKIPSVNLCMCTETMCERMQIRWCSFKVVVSTTAIIILVNEIVSEHVSLIEWYILKKGK